MRGLILSLLGALAGAALWVGITRISIPIWRPAIAALAAGMMTGLWMRLGAPAASRGQRMLPVAFSALSVVLCSYAAFVCNTAWIRLPDDSKATPVWNDPATLRFFTTEHLASWSALLLFLLAGYFAWSTSRK